MANQVYQFTFTFGPSASLTTAFQTLGVTGWQPYQQPNYSRGRFERRAEQVQQSRWASWQLPRRQPQRQRLHQPRRAEGLGCAQRIASPGDRLSGALTGNRAGVFTLHERQQRRVLAQRLDDGGWRDDA